ncbi:hypothetical protein QZH41_010145 [Actinostola sp. cb2023]|nr:hypothetical protein QZH41_010145 [Actinostola sp. cb2023]
MAFVNVHRSESRDSENHIITEMDDIDSPKAINEETSYFLEAVQRGDFETVKEFIVGKLVDINSIDADAQNENFEITKFLMKEGYKIEEPHAKYCDCSECTCRALGRLGCYLNNLNIYRALVSPVYISLVFLLQDHTSPSTKTDPVYRALVIKREILNHAEIEYEFREDYLQLAEKCEDFAVALLDQCRNLEEISIVMTLPGIKEVPGVEFIAHRFCQVMLNSVFYTGVQGVEENNHLLSALLVFLYWIFMPLLMVIYQFMPGNHWTKMLEIPIVKYLSHVVSMMWFIVLLVIAAFQDKLPKSEITDISVVEVVIGIWIAGMMLDEIKQFVRQGRSRYLSQWWRVLAAFVVLCFFITGVLWVADFGILAKSKGTVKVNNTDLYNFVDDPTRQILRLSSNSFYALGVILTFFLISHNFQVRSEYHFVDSSS